MRKRTWGRVILRVAIMGASLGTLSTFYEYYVAVNSMTAALTYLLVVLAAATLWGLPEAMLASALSMMCLDYYFLPPVPSFGIDDPQNWVAWCAFLITSFVVSHLSARLKKRAMEANQRRNEIERMYATELQPDGGQIRRPRWRHAFPAGWLRFLVAMGWPSSMPPREVLPRRRGDS